MTVKLKSAEHEKKTTGRPPTGRKGTPLQFYADDELIAAINESRRKEDDVPNQSEAIRRLIQRGLTVPPSKGGEK